MDTLSSVSHLSLPCLPPPPPPKSLSGRRFRTTTVTNLSRPSYAVSQRPTNSSSSPFAQNDRSCFLRTISFSCAKFVESSRTHENATSGYAAALVSICQSKNCLRRTQEHVARLVEFIDGCLVGEEMGEEVVKELVLERGKFGKYLKGLVKMLIERGRLGILVEVLHEFERICAQLVVGTKVVLVSS